MCGRRFRQLDVMPAEANCDGQGAVKSRPGKRAFVATFLTSVGIQATTILTGIAMARILGPEGRGLYAAGLLWSTVFASLGFFGVNHACTLRAAAHSDDRGALYGNVLIIGAGLSAFTTLAAFLLIPVIVVDDADVIGAAYTCLPFIPVFIFTSLLNSTDIGLGSFEDFNAMRWILTAVNVGTVATLFIAEVTDPEAYLLGLLAANCASLLYKLVRMPWREVCFTSRHLTVLAAGGGFYLATLTMLARDQIERIFLASTADLDQLGIYVVALSAAMMPSVLAKSLGLIVFSRSANIGGQDALLDTARLFRQLTLCNLFLSVGSVIVLPILIPLLYGQDFSAARPVVIVLILSQLLIAMGSVLDEGMRGQSRPTYGALGMGTMAAVFLALAILLLPIFGVVGVALAAASGHFACLLVLIALFKRLSPESCLLPRVGDAVSLFALLARLPLRRIANGGEER